MDTKHDTKHDTLAIQRKQKHGKTMKNMETSLDLHSLQQRLALVCSCLFVLPVLSCFTYVLYFVILPCYAMLYQNGVLKFSELSWKQPHILFVPCHPHRPVGQRHLTKRFRHAI